MRELYHYQVCTINQLIHKYMSKPSWNENHLYKNFHWAWDTLFRNSNDSSLCTILNQRLFLPLLKRWKYFRAQSPAAGVRILQTFNYDRKAALGTCELQTERLKHPMQEQISPGNQGVSSALKKTGCSFRGPGFNFQNPPSASQPSADLVSKDPTAFPGLHGHQAYTHSWTYMQAK